MVSPMLQCCNGWSNARSNGPMIGPMAQWSVQWSKFSNGPPPAHVCGPPHMCALTCQTPPGGRYIHGYILTKPWKMQAQLPLSTYAYIHMYMHTNIRAYIHTYIHTQWCQPAPLLAHVPAPSVLFEKNGDDFASWFSDKVGTFVIVPP